MTNWLQRLVNRFRSCFPAAPMKTSSRVTLFLALISITFSSALGQSLPAISKEGITGPETFVYRQIGARSLKVYVFLPKESAKDRAGILLFHGGAWRLGDASWMFDRAEEFAEKGMAAVSVDYSLSNDGLSPIDAVEDACAAFVWVRAHAARFGIDPHRVAGYGWSAGGHLVAAAATLPSANGRTISTSSRPDALLLYSPALNMARDAYFMQIMKGRGDPAKYSPSEYVSRGLPPTLIIQGEEDTIVLAQDARAFCTTVRKMGGRCELHVYPGVGHLLTRNLKVQYKDFDSDPRDAAEAHRLEDDFLVSLGYMQR